MSSQNEFLSAALRYRSIGLSVIPIQPRSKTPAINSWREYQDRLPTEDEIRQWWTQNPNAGIAIITGKISGLVVLDLDAKHNRSSKEIRDSGLSLPPTACARTGGGGEHFLYKYPKDRFKNHSGNIMGEGVDFKTDGGYIVVAPSVHSSGKAYEWTIPPEDGIADAPEWLIDKLRDAENEKTSWRTAMTQRVSEGARNSAAAVIAGGLLHTTPRESWETEAWPRLQKWNQEQCRPEPLTEKELRTTYESIASAEEKKQDDPPVIEEKPSQKMELLRLVTSDPNTELFRDNYGKGHVRVVVGNHKEIMECDKGRFRQWLSQSYLEQYGNIADPGALKAAIESVESTAAFKGKEYKLHNRVAKVGDTVWLDLADERNRAVRITAAGWEIINEPPILFRRHAHQSAQVEPQKGGKIEDLFGFINVTDPSLRLLLLVYLVECFIPDFPHALLYIHGQQGSAKSTLSRILRRLVDPSKTEVLHMPRDERELKLQLSRHHLVFYENVDGISNAISTVLCIGVTGGSSSERLYFTNGEDYILSFQLNIGINGINVSAVKADLLERSLLLELKPVEESNRRDESEIYQGFEAVRPQILGAILDVVSRALAIRPSVTLTAKPRMADFALWGVAVAEALGYTKERFLEAYGAKIKEQSEEALASSVEAAALLTFMQDKSEWTGTAQELLSELDFIQVDVGNHNQRIGARQLPKQPQVLMRRLNELKPNLRKEGIEITPEKKGGIRTILIRKIEDNTDQIVQTDLEHVEQGDLDDVDDEIPF